MKKARKLLVMGITMILSVGIFTALHAGAEELTVTQNNYQEIIKQQAAELAGVAADDMQVVELGGNGSVSTQSINDSNELALEVVTEIDGLVEHKIIIPKLVVGNELVNSFAYAEEMLNNMGDYGVMPMDADVPFYLIDTVLNVSCYYNKTTYVLGNNPLFTPKSLYFSWTSEHSGVDVEDVDVYFDCNGDYYRLNPYASMGYEKQANFSVYKWQPEKGVAYGDWAQAMDDNYALLCSDPGHCGIMDYSITYIVNGTRHYRAKGYPTTLFDKGGDRAW